MQWNGSYVESVFSFANNINTTEGGAHLSGFRAALTGTLNRYAREKGLAQGEGGEPRGRGRPRGSGRGDLGEAPQPAVRRSDEDEARQPADRGPRQDDRQPAARAVPGGEPDRGEADHHEGRLGRACPAGRAEGARADTPQERARLELAPGPPRRLPDLRPGVRGALPRRGRIGRWLGRRRARPQLPGDPAAARQGDQRREEPDQQGSLERGDPGDHHRDRHGHRRRVRRREAPLPPDHRHDGRRRGRRAHPDAHPHLPLPPDAGARRGRLRLHGRAAALPREDRLAAALHREGVAVRGAPFARADQGHGRDRPPRRDAEAHRGALRPARARS